MSDLREVLRIQPNSRVRLADLDPGATHGWDKAAAESSAKALGVPLVGGRGEHHTVAQLIADGYQVLTF